MKQKNLAPWANGKKSDCVNDDVFIETLYNSLTNARGVNENTTEEGENVTAWLGRKKADSANRARGVDRPEHQEPRESNSRRPKPWR